MHALPTRVRVALPPKTFATHNQRLRAELRGYFDQVPNRRLVVARGAFCIEIRGDRRYWLPQVEELLADVGLNVDTGTPNGKMHA